MANPKLNEARAYLKALKAAVKKRDKLEILSLYEEDKNSDIEWDDKDVIPESIALLNDELIDLADDILYS